ncbi:hypothetical protein RJ641_003021 [Dillenia turbinata]|uniref:Rrn7/TAF1B N-terminal cyclin domain-containing protein n=1 Tax=Dillenia turbinata TaxID=194707 RepID=A0AAN8VP30_9MAGN
MDKQMCQTCSNIGFDDGEDGFFYCRTCGSKADDIIDTAVADEDFIGEFGSNHGALYSAAHRRANIPIKAEPLSQSQPSLFHSHLFQTLDTEDDDKKEKNRVFQNDAVPFRGVKKEELDDDFGGDGVGPTGPSDFGGNMGGELSYDDYYNEVRIKYVLGMQMMVQMQCEALVEKFGVNPLVCGLVGSIWLRLVGISRVFDEGWADKAIHESESQKEGEAGDFKPRAKFRAEPHNIHGERAVIIWFRSLRSKVPLSYSLSVSFLACHLAREAVLPTDIAKWTLEGSVPYFSAYVEIEKQLGKYTRACPFPSSFMFKPQYSISPQKLVSQAASIAQSIGLHMPPVNFHAIASRYLRLLCLDVEKILPHACRIFEWSMPPDLWLSANELRLPARVCVMSILIVAIRILYNINGFGKWENSLSSSGDSSNSTNPVRKSDSVYACEDPKMGSPSSNVENLDTKPAENSSSVHVYESDASQLLCNLEARHAEINPQYEYSEDLPSYLQYCKDVLFSGCEPSYDDREEEKLIEQLLDFYQNHKDEGVECCGELGQKRVRDEETCTRNLFREYKRTREGSEDFHSDDGLQLSISDDDSSEGSMRGQDSMPSNRMFAETLKDEATRRLKCNMEESRFCYIPPRVKVKRYDYLHYVRKKVSGALTCVAHADYYILLRACATAAQVDIRVMHMGVLSFERRLGWIENRIDHCLKLKPPDWTCEYCSNAQQDATEDEYSIGLSDLNL